MNWQAIITVVLGVVSVGATFVSYYFFIKNKALDAAKDAVNSAEPEDGSGVGAEKMEQAVNQIYELIPVAMKPIINKTVIKGLVQKAFDSMEEYAKKQVQKEKNKEQK